MDDDVAQVALETLCRNGCDNGFSTEREEKTPTVTAALAEAGRATRNQVALTDRAEPFFFPESR